MLRRPSFHFASPAIAGGLLVLLLVLAVFQYRWIGEVSRAERERLRASLDSATARFADDLDLELAQALTAFRLDPRAHPSVRAEELKEHWTRWSERSNYPRLLRELMLVRRDGAGAWNLERFDPAAAALEPANWPRELQPLRALLALGPAARRAGTGRLTPAVDWAAYPVLIAPVFGGPEQVELLLMRLDLEVMTGTLLPDLAERHFGEPDGLVYDVLVVHRDDPTRVVYRTRDTLDARTLGTPDAAADLLHLPAPNDPRGRGPRWRPTRRERAGARANAERPPPRRPRERGTATSHGRDRPGEGAWRVLVRHRAGSLEAVVAQARLRNLALSLGVLSLLGASIAFLAASTRRAHALARQQIEFVAGVTHELHTPLAGIRSAAQNLKDGVAAEPAQVRRYGGLIEKEGRRLSDMLEQVLEFAGIHGGGRVLRRAPVGVPALVDEALQGCRFVIEERGVEVETQVAPDLPPLDADADALRAALRNVIVNAAKYGGGWLRVSAERAEGAVVLRVEDRGPGIAAADRPHIFKPFYRGQHAAGAPGSGLGLSIVKRVVEAHGGSVRMAPRAEGGTCFTLRLPAGHSPAVRAGAAEATS